MPITGIEVLVGLAANLASSAIWEGGKRMLTSTAVSEAINRTAAMYPDLEPLQFQLRKWYDSREFNLLLEDLKKPGASITNDEVVSSFIKVGGFYTGEKDERETAQKILTTFRGHLLNALLSSEGGLIYLQQQEQALHAITHDKLADIGARLTALPDELLRKLQEQSDAGKQPTQCELEILPINESGHNIFTMSWRERERDRSLYVYLDFRVKSNVPAEILSMDMQYGEGHLALNQEVFEGDQPVPLDDLTLLVPPIQLEPGVTKRIKLKRVFSPSLSIDFSEMDDELFEIIRERLDYGLVTIKMGLSGKGLQGEMQKTYRFRLAPGGRLNPVTEDDSSIRKASG